MTTIELERHLDTRRHLMSLGERVALRTRIDRESGVTYPEPTDHQSGRLARITGPGLRRIVA